MISPPRALLSLAVACFPACVGTSSNDPSAPTMQSTNADVHTQLATAALERGSLESARASAREALRVDPGRVDAAKVLARANLLSGEPQAALFAAKRATRLAPEDATSWLLLADCAAANSDDPERSAALARAAELGSSEARFVLAFEALSHGDDSPLAALESDPTAQRAALGLVIDRLGASRRIGDALTLLDSEFARTRDESLALTADRLRFALTREQGQPPTEATEAPMLDPTTAPSERVLLEAARHLAAGRSERAADLYRALLTREPQSVEIRVALAESLLATGDRAGAAAALRAALTIDSQDLAATHGLARIEIEDGQFDRALDRLETARSRNPRDPATVALIVVAAHRSGRLERARIEAEKLAELDPGGRFDRACRKLLAANGTQPTGGS
jgi:Flp pilus assembly protein TadD